MSKKNVHGFYIQHASAAHRFYVLKLLLDFIDEISLESVKFFYKCTQM